MQKLGLGVGTNLMPAVGTTGPGGLNDVLLLGTGTNALLLGTGVDNLLLG